MDNQTQQAKPPRRIEWKETTPSWWEASLLGLINLDLRQQGPHLRLMIYTFGSVGNGPIAKAKEGLDCTLEEAKNLAEQLGLELLILALEDWLTPAGAAALFKGAELTPIQRAILRCAETCNVSFDSDEAVQILTEAGGRREALFLTALHPSPCMVESVELLHTANGKTLYAQLRPRPPTDEEKARYLQPQGEQAVNP